MEIPKNNAITNCAVATLGAGCIRGGKGLRDELGERDRDIIEVRVVTTDCDIVLILFSIV